MKNKKKNNNLKPSNSHSKRNPKQPAGYKRKSRWSLFILLLFIVAGVGIINASADISGDTMPPLTSVKVEGPKEKLADDNWYYKDKVEVKLYAIDKKQGDQINKSSFIIDKIPSESDLSITYDSASDKLIFERTGMTYNGINYMDKFSNGGSYLTGVIFSSIEEGNGILPLSLPLSEFKTNYSGNNPYLEPQDIYVYLVTTNIGDQTVHLTFYDTKIPIQFAQFGLNVDAYAKVFSYSEENGYMPVSLPVKSAGIIVPHGNSGGIEILPSIEGGGYSSSSSVSGVDKTYYRIGEAGDFIEYKSPIKLKGQGNYTVYYYSTDKAGNLESVKNIDFTIGPQKDLNKIAQQELKKLLENLKKEEEKNRKITQELENKSKSLVKKTKTLMQKLF